MTGKKRINLNLAPGIRLAGEEYLTARQSNLGKFRPPVTWTELVNTALDHFFKSQLCAQERKHHFYRSVNLGSSQARESLEISEHRDQIGDVVVDLRSRAEP